MNNSGPLQFVEKTFSQCSSEITAEFALPCLIDPSTEKNMHNTHTNPGLDNPFRLILPICHSAFHCKVNQYRTNIPFNYTGRCIPKAQRGPLQNQVAAFQRYKIHFKKSLSLPHGNHLLSSIITRPTTHDQVFWRLHLSFNFLLSKDCSLFW